jgi:hypothetical protein
MGFAKMEHVNENITITIKKDGKRIVTESPVSERNKYYSDCKWGWWNASATECWD